MAKLELDELEPQVGPTEHALRMLLVPMPTSSSFG